MAAMDSLTVARSLRGSIGMLAMAWLLDESTMRRGAELGLNAEGMGGYAVGRLGVLGALHLRLCVCRYLCLYPVVSSPTDLCANPGSGASAPVAWEQARHSYCAEDIVWDHTFVRGTQHANARFGSSVSAP